MSASHFTQGVQQEMFVRDADDPPSVHATRPTVKKQRRGPGRPRTRPVVERKQQLSPDEKRVRLATIIQYMVHLDPAGKGLHTRTICESLYPPRTDDGHDLVRRAIDDVASSGLPLPHQLGSFFGRMKGVTVPILGGTAHLRRGRIDALATNTWIGSIHLRADSVAISGSPAS